MFCPHFASWVVSEFNITHRFSMSPFFWFLFYLNTLGNIHIKNGGWIAVYFENVITLNCFFPHLYPLISLIFQGCFPLLGSFTSPMKTLLNRSGGLPLQPATALWPFESPVLTVPLGSLKPLTWNKVVSGDCCVWNPQSMCVCGCMCLIERGRDNVFEPPLQPTSCNQLS